MNKQFFFFLLGFALAFSAPAETGRIEAGKIRFACGPGGVSALANPRDPYGAQLTPADRPFGLVVRYRCGAGEWRDFDLKAARLEAAPASDRVTYTAADDSLRAVQTFCTDGVALDWTIDLQATGAGSVTIGDLAIVLPVVGPWGENASPQQIFERGFLPHPFVSGNGSFVYYVRASGVPPFLLLTVLPGTSLEYTGGWSQFYIHSGLSGGNETRGTWRQPHTFLTLGHEAGAKKRVQYGFRFQWADSYDDLRDLLFREGLFDIRVVPGMTVPDDLPVRLALRTRARIDSLEAEFPEETLIADRGETGPGYRLYEVSFRRLGENMLTIHHDGGGKTTLEFFVTEPIETLIRKRASFLVDRQQIRDPAKWWDGVFAPFDMKNNALRTVDDKDIFTGRMAYVLTCDDPGLCKAPFVAAKNACYPDDREIAGLEYYLQHFVWGRLQRTDAETPYPYGVYGTPDWYTNRDPARRAAYTDKNLDKMHVWRSYDYPHMVMLYYHMYEIARKYPQRVKYLDASGYLERAFQTARAFYIYPYEIFPSYYETYKWGLYNELVVMKLAGALEREGYSERAAWLRGEWEKKVKYFVYDDPYPFRSEYDFDRTAFESSYAFAKYGATHEMKPDRHLWWDVQKKKWYSHPEVRCQDSRAFMERQLAAGLSVRGWLNASYYRLGADGGLSYMAAMGGWGILDYALNFAAAPYDWLQLGYASYLSSWCLVNSGRPDTQYGFWFPGKEKDGAAGWQFQSAKWGHAWMGEDVPRGPWRYDGEIDLGFGGALRMASTVLTRDPIFDWIAYGGTLSGDGDKLSIVPRDGLRQRFAAVLPDPRLPWAFVRRFKLELDRDGFAAGRAIVTDKDLDSIAFTLENRGGNAHLTELRLSLPAGTRYRIILDGRDVPLRETGEWDYPRRADLPLGGGPARVEIVRER
jgi:hypothetical protein